MTTYSIKEAANEVIDWLKIGGSHYFNLIVDEKEYQIRVSDHSGRRLNNDCAVGTYEDYFSFVTNFCRQDSKISNEFLCDEDGYMTEQFHNVEECLEFFLS